MSVSTHRRKGLKQFFSFFGSKVAHAKHYPTPLHSTIIEPFAGSAGYSCLYFEHDIRLYDADPIIVSIWSYLINASRNDIIGLPLDPANVRTLSDAERWFIGFWWRRCGAQPSGSPVPWALSGKFATSFWGERVRFRIAEQIHLINHWHCALLDYKDVRIDKTATWFIDPPYQQQGHRYTHSRIDYPALSEWVTTLCGQKIVCEAAGANWLPFERLYDNRTVKYTKAARTIEEQVFVLTTKARP